MKRRDAGALLIGVAILIIFLPYVLTYLGLSEGWVDPFRPIVYVTVTTTPWCDFLGNCYIGEEGTTVDITTYQQVSVLPLSQYGVCNLVHQWGEMRVRLTIPQYNLVMIQPGFGTTRICDNPVIHSFRFNYNSGDCFVWTVDILDREGDQLYQLSGNQCMP